MARNWIAGVILVIVAIQFVPVNTTPPPVRDVVTFADPAVAALVGTACYDCQSNENVWPWYGAVAPISWIVAGHIQSARGRLNFSDLAATRAVIDQRTGQPRSSAELQLAVENVFERDLMPPPYYLMTHPAANLTPAQAAAIRAGIAAALTADGR